MVSRKKRGRKSEREINDSLSLQDIINDTKGAQMDDRDTFLGIGQNR